MWCLQGRCYMPKKTFFCDENIPFWKSRIDEILKDLVESKGFTSLILIDENILSDCFKHAKETVKFYGLDEGEVSHYKEISHIAFWISKLKPISIESPQRLQDRLKTYGIDLLKELAGESPLLVQQRTSDSDFAINEYLAFTFATISIRTCQLSEIHALDAPEQVTLYQNLMGGAMDRVKRMQRSTLRSMRYHNYSARAFATTMEAMTRLGAI